VAGFAQEQARPQDTPGQAESEAAGPEDAHGRGTPRGSMQGFFAATAAGDYEKAAHYLDLRNLPAGLGPDDGPDLARQLDIVFERELFWIDIDGLSNKAEGLPGDDLPAYRDELARIETRDGDVVLLLQRVPREDREFVWKISNRTVAQIPGLYAEFGYGKITEWAAELLPDVSVLGLALFKWVVLLGAAIIAYPLLLVLTRGLARFLSKPGSPVHQQVSRFVTRPVLWLLLVVFLHQVILGMGIGIEVQQVARARTVLTVIVVWALLSLVNLGRAYYVDRLRKRGQESAEVLLRPVGNAVKILVIIVAALVWLENAGFDITTLLAGLGVGGIAIALALQKPMEDLFGALSLYTQQPVKVGDFCRFGSMMGAVEEIGLRASRIRTLANTVICVPNSRLAAEYIENFSMREKLWYHPKIGLRYETSPDQLRYVLIEIRKMLYAHPRVLPDGLRVRFVDIGPHSLDIQIHAYTATNNFIEHLEISEDLNLRVLDIVALAGTALAYPTQTLHVEKEEQVDGERARAVEQEVRRWREDEELYITEMPPDKIEEIAGSIMYPPPGTPKPDN
jgi:MscS family membrane protein